MGNGPVQTQKICMDVTTVKCELTKPQTDSITVLTFLHTIPAEIYGCYYRKIRINKDTVTQSQTHRRHTGRQTDRQTDICKKAM